MQDWLDHLLTAPVERPSLENSAAWWHAHRLAAGEFDDTVARAAAGGFAADRMAYAFASGYQEALHRLLGPRAQPGPCRSLAATEDGGPQPRAIKTTLADGRLNGVKTFVTMGALAQELVVFASVGKDKQGINRLAAVVIPTDRDGVVMSEAPAMHFAPEVKHSKVVLTDVLVNEGERLEGDGYDVYLKPFRTVEDVHVFVGLCGWLIRVGRQNDWPSELLEDLVALLVALGSVSKADPSAPSVHVAVAGWLRRAMEVVSRLDTAWLSAPREDRERWERDLPLLQVASGARHARAAAAWRRLRAEDA